MKLSMEVRIKKTIHIQEHSTILINLIKYDTKNYSLLLAQ